MHAHIEAGLVDEFSAVLDRLNSVIDDPRWTHRLVFQRAFLAMGHEWNEELAKQALRGFTDIAAVEDAELLAFYHDVMGDELSLDARRELARRVAANTDDPAIRLQYRIIDHLELLKIGEVAEATKGIGAAITAFEVETQDPSTSSPDAVRQAFRWYKLGGAHSLLGSLADDPGSLERARDAFRASLETQVHNSIGRAELLREIGICHLRLGESEHAAEFMRKSLYEHPLDRTKIVLAEVQLAAGQLKEAASSLDAINWESLPSHEQYDWAIVSGGLALAAEDETRARMTAERLEQLNVLPGIFERTRHKLVVALLKLSVPASANLQKDMFLMLQELLNEGRLASYLLESVKADTDEIVNTRLSEAAREALERKGTEENLATDRRLARTTGQKIARLGGKRVVKAVVGELEGDALEVAKGIAEGVSQGTE